MQNTFMTFLLIRIILSTPVLPIGVFEHTFFSLQNLFKIKKKTLHLLGYNAMEDKAKG